MSSPSQEYESEQSDDNSHMENAKHFLCYQRKENEQEVCSDDSSDASPSIGSKRCERSDDDEIEDDDEFDAPPLKSHAPAKSKDLISHSLGTDVDTRPKAWGPNCEIDADNIVFTSRVASAGNGFADLIVKVHVNPEGSEHKVRNSFITPAVRLGAFYIDPPQLGYIHEKEPVHLSQLKKPIMDSTRCVKLVILQSPGSIAGQDRRFIDPVTQKPKEGCKWYTQYKKDMEKFANDLLVDSPKKLLNMIYYLREDERIPRRGAFVRNDKLERDVGMTLEEYMDPEIGASRINVTVSQTTPKSASPKNDDTVFVEMLAFKERPHEDVLEGLSPEDKLEYAAWSDDPSRTDTTVYAFILFKMNLTRSLTSADLQNYNMRPLITEIALKMGAEEVHPVYYMVGDDNRRTLFEGEEPPKLGPNDYIRLELQPVVSVKRDGKPDLIKAPIMTGVIEILHMTSGYSGPSSKAPMEEMEA